MKMGDGERQRAELHHGRWKNILNGSAKGKEFGDVVTWGDTLSFCEFWS